MRTLPAPLIATGFAKRAAVRGGCRSLPGCPRGWIRGTGADA